MPKISAVVMSHSGQRSFVTTELTATGYRETLIGGLAEALNKEIEKLREENQQLNVKLCQQKK